MKQEKTTWLDVYLNRFKWYRRKCGGTWHEHKFTKDAAQLRLDSYGNWWARYGEINRYSEVVGVEVYDNKK